MPPRKKSVKEKKSCVCGDNCHEQDSHLPGLLLMALSLVALPINLGLVPGMEWAVGWPVLGLLLGVALVAKVMICKSSS
jgi:hypothetical protein